MHDSLIESYPTHNTVFVQFESASGLVKFSFTLSRGAWDHAWQRDFNGRKIAAAKDIVSNLLK